MTEQKKSRKGCMIALAVVGVFAIAVGIFIVFAVFKAKDFVEGFAEGVGVSEEMQQDVRNLNDRYAFTPPEDNLITEGQIQEYIDIKKSFAEKIKAREEQFKALSEKADAGQYGLSEYAESWKVLGEVRRDLLRALNEHGMSPREYAFLTAQIYQTSYINFASGLAEMAENMGASPKWLRIWAPRSNRYRRWKSTWKSFRSKIRS